ncbi:MAG TPA: P-loop NTPase fold protein [Mucilaginibacter sp.]|jgi:hypothetical protein
MTDDAIILETLKFIRREARYKPYVNIIDTLWNDYEIDKQEHLKRELLKKRLINLKMDNSWEFQLTSEGMLAIETGDEKLENDFLNFLASQADVESFMINNFIKPDPKSRNTTNETDEGVIFLKNLKRKGLIDYNDEALAHVNTWFVDGGADPEIKRWFDTLHEPFYVNIIRKSGLQPDLKSQSSKVAELTSDSDDGEDYLDIRDDINAFAKIMAADTFKPPLAVALFGKWGTGKSFFIKKLRDRVTYFSHTGDNMYCSGIAQIHFNAWSYLDSNLWASIVSKILDGLNVYIGANKKADMEVETIKASLMEQLSLNYLEVDRIKKEQEVVINNIQKLIEQKEKLVEGLATKRQELDIDSYSKVVNEVNEKFKIKERIKSAFEANPAITAAGQAIGEIIPEEYLDDPKVALQQVKSTVTYIKIFFSRKKIVSNLLWLITVVLVVYYAPKGLNWLISKIKGSDFTFPPLNAMVRLLGAALPVLHLIKRTYRQLQPLVVSLWKIKGEYDTALKDAEFNFSKEEKKLTAAIAASERQITEIDSLIKEKEKKKVVLEYKKEHALSTEALYHFIAKRTISEDYQQHLGIVSVIRRDFEALSDLFYEHNRENKHQDFLANFDHPLQRIILYIDDLDRCPEDRVVEVLEAVNLLMAFPLFIVVVGVDRRWVKNALLRRYSSQFLEVSEDQIDPSDYLEKIFQVPFHLKMASNRSVRKMIRALSQPSNAFDFEPDAAIYDDDSPIVKDREAANASEKNKDENTSAETTQLAHVKEERLRLSKREIELMEDMSVVLGDNPRAIKRFVNIYQIVRAHEGLTYIANQEEHEFLVLMFLVALYNGRYRKIVQYFVNYMHSYKKEEKPLSIFLQGPEKSPAEVSQLKKELYVALSDNSTYHTLLQVNMATFKTHNTFIQRFSFDEIVIPSIVQSDSDQL